MCIALVCLCLSVSPCSQLSGGTRQLAILASTVHGVSMLTGRGLDRLHIQVCLCAGT